MDVKDTDKLQNPRVPKSAIIFTLLPVAIRFACHELNGRMYHRMNYALKAYIFTFTGTSAIKKTYLWSTNNGKASGTINRRQNTGKLRSSPYYS